MQKEGETVAAKKHKKKKRKLDFSKLRGVAYLMVSVVLLGLLVSDYYKTIETQKKEMAEVTAQKEALEKEKAAIQLEIEMLNNEDYITRYARENYVFTKDGETVVILPQKNQ